MIETETRRKSPQEIHRVITGNLSWRLLLACYSQMFSARRCPRRRPSTASSSSLILSMDAISAQYDTLVAHKSAKIAPLCLASTHRGQKTPRHSRNFKLGSGPCVSSGSFIRVDGDSLLRDDSSRHPVRISPFVCADGRRSAAVTRSPSQHLA